MATPSFGKLIGAVLTLGSARDFDKLVVCVFGQITLFLMPVAVPQSTPGSAPTAAPAASNAPTSTEI